MSAPVLERTPTVTTTWPEIHGALRKLWRACLADQEGSDVSRALTANFLGLAEAPDADALREATERLQRRTPCRAFLLILDDAAAGNEARLSATTRRHGRLRDIVLEEITLRLPQRAIDQLPGLIRPLLVNDLPTHLYWAAPWPAVEQDFDQLRALCDHAVVDSRRFGNPARELAVIAHRRTAGQRLTDLAWLRLRPWRRALAEAFERFPWRPGTRTRGSVRHGPKAASAAILLADWLHERLGASLTLAPDGDPAAPGPDRITLLVDGVEVVLEAVGGDLRTHVTTADRCLLPFAVRAARGGDGDLLAAAIDLG